MNLTFIILLFIVSIIAFISTLDSTFALLQYSNYTSEKLLVQFQYPLTWKITESNGSLDEDPYIEITDPLLGVGYIVLAHTTIPDYGPSDAYLDIGRLMNVSLQAFLNDSSTEKKVIENISHLTIDGQKAATFTYMAKDPLKDDLVTKAKVWVVLVGNGYYTLGFGTDFNTDLFHSREYTEMRDRFINSIKFLEVDNSLVNNSSRSWIFDAPEKIKI